MKRRLYPPHWGLIALALEFALFRFAPVARVIPAPFNWAGALVIVAGLAFGGWAIRWFKRKKTGVVPFSPSTAVIVEGPYRFTRNPIYVGMTAVLLGSALIFGALTPLLVPFAFVALIHYRFVLPEEAHMERAIGAPYLEFKSNVRRWL